jgi:hypothetical protein
MPSYSLAHTQTFLFISMIMIVPYFLVQNYRTRSREILFERRLEVLGHHPLVNRCGTGDSRCWEGVSQERKGIGVGVQGKGGG